MRLGVAHSGPGFSPEQAALLNERECAPGDHALGIGPRGPGGQTGYGLGIVQEIITARHGTVRAERAPEGGALVRILLPDGIGGPTSRRRPADCN